MFGAKDKLRKNFEILSFFILLIFLIPFFLANWVGFCFENITYLDNSDLIKIAVVDQISLDREFIPIKISNYESFIKEFPRCCTLTPLRNGIRDSFLRIIGCRTYSVEISYPIKFGRGELLSLGDYEINSCGQITNRKGTHY